MPSPRKKPRRPLSKAKRDAALRKQKQADAAAKAAELETARQEEEQQAQQQAQEAARLARLKNSTAFLLENRLLPDDSPAPLFAPADVRSLLDRLFIGGDSDGVPLDTAKDMTEAMAQAAEKKKTTTTKKKRVHAETLPPLAPTAPTSSSGQTKRTRRTIHVKAKPVLSSKRKLATKSRHLRRTASQKRNALPPADKATTVSPCESSANESVALSAADRVRIGTLASRKDTALGAAGSVEAYVTAAHVGAVSHARDHSARRASKGILVDVDSPRARSILRGQLDPTILSQQGLLDFPKVCVDTAHDQTVLLTRSSSVLPILSDTHHPKWTAHGIHRAGVEELCRDRDARLLEEKRNRVRAIRTQERISVGTLRHEAAMSRYQLLATMMPASETEENMHVLRRINDRVNFLRNPRFADASNASSANIIAEPPTVVFTKYERGGKYVARLCLRNVGNVSCRLRVVPPESEFFASSVPQYAIRDKLHARRGLMAPGTACVVRIRFRPDALHDYEDNLRVLTNAGELLVPLRAQRPRPLLALPDVWDCGACLVNASKESEFVFRNRGSAGRFWVRPLPAEYSDRDIVASPDDIEALMNAPVQKTVAIGNSFHVSPGDFSVDVRGCSTLRIEFSPRVEGTEASGFLLVCDNTQVVVCHVMGQACAIRLETTHIDGQTLSPDPDATTLVAFPDVALHSATVRRVTVRNASPVPVPCTWQCVLADGTELQAPTDDEPRLASMWPREITFEPLQSLEFDLMVHPETVQPFYVGCRLVPSDVSTILGRSEDVLRSGLPDKMPVFVSLSCQGRAVAPVLVVDPPVLTCGRVIGGIAGTPTDMRVTLHNASDCEVGFSWLPCSFDNGLSVSFVPASGTLSVHESIQVSVTVVMDRAVGSPSPIDIEAECEVGGGENVRLRVIGEACGAPVIIVTPEIDFGSLNIGLSGASSTCNVEVLNMGTAETTFELQETARAIVPETHPCGSLTFGSCGALGPGERMVVPVVFRPSMAVPLETCIECISPGSPPSFVRAHGVVVSPKVSLSPSQRFVLEAQSVHEDAARRATYLGIARHFVITVQNSSLIGACFGWKSIDDEDAFVSFSPETGTVAGQSSMEIRVTFVAHRVGSISVVLKCGVEGYQEPLAVVCETHVRGLDVSFFAEQEDSKLIVFDPLCVRQCNFVDVVVENKSGIDAMAHFSFDALTLSPRNLDKAAHYFEAGVWPCVEGMSNVADDRIVPFSSDSGKFFVAKRERLAIESGFLACGQGVRLAVWPTQVTLHPFTTRRVRVFVFCDMQGHYNDVLRCRVEGAPECDALLPVRVHVIGLPVSFEPSVGLSTAPGQEPHLQWRPQCAGSDVSHRTLRIANAGPVDLLLRWRLFHVNTQEMFRVVVDTSGLEERDGHVVTTIAPRVLTPVDGDFGLSVERETFVPARGNCVVTVSFNASSPNPQTCEAFLEAVLLHRRKVDRVKPSGEAGTEKQKKEDTEEGDDHALRNIIEDMDRFEAEHGLADVSDADEADDGQEKDISSSVLAVEGTASTGESEWVPLVLDPYADSFRVRVSASSVVPALRFHKMPDADGISRVRDFCYDAGESDTCSHATVLVSNLSQAISSFEVMASPKHFKVVGLSSTVSMPRPWQWSRQASVPPRVQLDTGENVTVTIRFKAPDTWSLAKRIAHVDGVLHCRFTRMQEQAISLRATLRRPVVSLSSKRIDFGAVPVVGGVPRELGIEPSVFELLLRNVGESAARWRIEEDKEWTGDVLLPSAVENAASAVRFVPNEGVLARGVGALASNATPVVPSLGGIAQLPQRVRVVFAPRNSGIHRAHFTLVVLHGAGTARRQPIVVEGVGVAAGRNV